jgi:integrase/recombinase XerD
MYLEREQGIRLKFDYSMLKHVRCEKPSIDYATQKDVLAMLPKLKTRQDRLMLLTLFSTGLRISELLKLRVEDIHEKGGGTAEIHIRGKGAKKRIIPIDQNLTFILMEHTQENGQVSGPLFRSQTGLTFTPSGFRKRLQRQLEPYGLYKKPHAQRHGYATMLMERNINLRSLQTVLGHEDIRTTQIYTHVTNPQLRKDVLSHFPSDEFNVRTMLT